MPTYVYACCMYMYMYIQVDLVYQSFVLRSVQMWKVLGFVTNTCTAHASPSGPWLLYNFLLQSFDIQSTYVFVLL